MITESTYLETTRQQENTMVATDQNKDFANCENKSEALNVVNPCNFSFIPNSNSTKLNDDNLRFENLNSESNDDVDDYSRPKKLQKNNNQGLNINNSNANVQNSLNNSETDFNIKKQNLNTLNKNLSLNNPSVSNENLQQNNLTISTNTKRKTNLATLEIEEEDEKLVTKENLATNLNFAETVSAPKVPPLRIVISSSSSGRNNLKDGSISNSSSSENSSNLSISKNYVVSSAIDSSSNLNTANNYNYLDKRQEANDNYYTRSSNNLNTIGSSSSTNSAGGRITRSQRAAAQNSSTDDFNSRFSPDELSNDYTSVSENNETGLYNNNSNNQNLKIEKESNKENKDLRRRKGRGKSSQNQTSNNNSSNHIVNNSTNSSLNFDNGLMEETDQTMISNNPSTSNLNVNSSSRDFQMPSYNCLNMFQNIRKQVDKRRQTMCNSINPKAPQGFKDYLLNTGNYLLENRKKTTHNVNPNLTIDQIIVPDKLNETKNNSLLIDLYKEQDIEREKLKVQHLVEKEKVKLSIEQEILRVYSRAALAMANQSLPFSFATIMKDEEIYNTIDPENEHTPSFDGRNLDSSTSQKESSKNEYSRATYSCISNNSFADLFTLTGKSEDIGSRCRYSGRLLHSWLQDVEDKWGKIKKETIHRQKREAESLQAIQKLNWEWKVKEFGKKIKLKIEEAELECESKNVEKFNEKAWSENLIIDELVPLVKVNEDFDFS